MGRHRRSDAVPAVEEHAAGAADGRHRGARRKKRGALPVRGGLLGASAAMAVGAVAVASGILPGGDTFTLGSGSGDPSGGQIRSDSAPELNAQGGSSAAPTLSAPSSPSPSPSPSATAPSKSPSPKLSPTAPSSSPARTKTASPTPTKATTAPAPTATATPQKTKAAAAESALSREAAAEAAVLDLVNKERAGAGCSPLTASSELGALAGAFSQDMAERDFFSHTDPDGDSPWDRAAQAGIEGLGGENIARGQADAAAVMDAWMNSDGHRANILNCDFRTLGVGVHFGDGGPWWTQNFGF